MTINESAKFESMALLHPPFSLHLNGWRVILLIYFTINAHRGQYEKSQS